MALEFQHRSAGPAPRRVAIFPGAWNPPTAAHVAIARAALGHAEEVVWVLPRAFPHKRFEGADFHARIEMLGTLARTESRFSAAVSDGGLYLEIALEARAHFGPATEIALVCGRDAAERIAGWDYGSPGVFDAMLEEFPLLVAARDGEYLPAAEHQDRIIRLSMPAGFDEVSSTEVRRRIVTGEPWRHLVPEAIVDNAARLYGCSSE